MELRNRNGYRYLQRDIESYCRIDWCDTFGKSYLARNNNVGVLYSSLGIRDYSVPSTLGGIFRLHRQGLKKLSSPILVPWENLLE